MSKDKDIEMLKKDMVPVLERNNVDFAALFGSYARGEAKSDSDVDLLVRFGKPKSLFDIAGLQIEIEDTISKEVDIVTEDALSPYIKDNVIRDSVVIYGER
ncbi:MAG: nucleotidyltransferase family protein [Parcubacteria group bacterium]|nr:nucleotidyltransferase family protein [Parcubacteria group bacterium]